jgi:hypothetical protein
VLIINFLWKFFDKHYSNFVMSNQDDVSNFLDKNFYNIKKIKDIIDTVDIRTDLMTEEDIIYKEKNIKAAYNMIIEKFASNIPLSNFENNLFRYIHEKFERFKILKTVFLSIYFTFLLTIISIAITVFISILISKYFK